MTSAASAIAQLTATERLQRIIEWCDAYPEDVFIPVSSDDMQRARQALKEHGVTLPEASLPLFTLSLGAMQGQWARHILAGIKRIAIEGIRGE